MAKSDDYGKEFFEKQFYGYTITEIKPEYYEETGWHIYLKMWKKKKPKPKGGRKKNEGRRGKKKKKT